MPSFDVRNVGSNAKWPPVARAQTHSHTRTRTHASNHQTVERNEHTERYMLETGQTTAVNAMCASERTIWTAEPIPRRTTYIQTSRATTVVSSQQSSCIEYLIFYLPSVDECRSGISFVASLFNAECVYSSFTTTSQCIRQQQKIRINFVFYCFSCVPFFYEPFNEILISQKKKARLSATNKSINI